MLNLVDIKNDRDLINAIDWDMTPEEAVRLYLEWGCNWARSNYVIRSPQDVAHYFVVYSWDDTPVIYLIKRNSEEAVELAKINPPKHIRDNLLKEYGKLKGVFAIEGDVKNWLKKELLN